MSGNNKEPQLDIILTGDWIEKIGHDALERLFEETIKVAYQTAENKSDASEVFTRVISIFPQAVALLMSTISLGYIQFIMSVREILLGSEDENGKKGKRK